MRKHSLVSTASSLALVAFSASALMLAPTAAHATAPVSIANGTTHVYDQTADDAVNFAGATGTLTVNAGQAVGGAVTTTGNNAGTANFTAASSTTAGVGAASHALATVTAAGAGTVTVGTTLYSQAVTVGDHSANAATLAVTGGVASGTISNLTVNSSGVTASSKLTALGATNLNLSVTALTFDATEAVAGAGAVNRQLFTVAATGTGTLTGPSSFAVTGAGANYVFKNKVTAGASGTDQVIALKNSAYYSSTIAGVRDGAASASERNTIGSILENGLAAGSLDTTGSFLHNYLTGLENAPTAAGKAAKIDQAAAQTNVQVANNLATGFMGVVSDRTGALQGTRVAAGDTGLSSGDANRDSAVWAKAFGSLGRQDSRGGQAGFDTDNGGFAVGFEKKLSPATTAGVSVAYGAGQYQSNEAGAPKTTSSDDYQASIYGSSYVSPNWYVDGQVGGGYHTFNEGNTYLGIGQASATYHAWGYFGQIGTGYDFHTSSPAVVTPFANLAYQSVDYNGYTESGAGALDRHVGSDTAQTLTGHLGARVAWQGLNLWNSKVTPEIHAAYLHDFEQQGLSATSNFVGTGNSSTFTTSGQGLAKDGYTAGLGLTVARANGWNFDANYDYEGRDGYTGNSGTLEAKYAF